MDHYATSLGSVLYMDFQDQTRVEKLPVNLGDFVLGDSLEPKDTKGILNRVKNGVLEIAQILTRQVLIVSFNLGMAGSKRN